MSNAALQRTEDPPQGGALFAPAAKKPVAGPLEISTLYLQAADIHEFMRVQGNVRPELAQPYHLKERTENDIRVHLAERMPLIGARAHTSGFDPGTPVAGCLLSFLKNRDSIRNLAGYPEMNGSTDVTAIVQSLCVDPAYAGRGISQTVLDIATSTAQQNGMTRIISAIADDNEKSIRTFEKAGYKPFMQGIDPNHGYAKTFYQLTL